MATKNRIVTVWMSKTVLAFIILRISHLGLVVIKTVVHRPNTLTFTVMAPMVKVLFTDSNAFFARASTSGELGFNLDTSGAVNLANLLVGSRPI